MHILLQIQRGRAAGLFNARSDTKQQIYSRTQKRLMSSSRFQRVMEIYLSGIGPKKNAMILCKMKILWRRNDSVSVLSPLRAINKNSPCWKLRKQNIDLQG